MFSKDVVLSIQFQTLRYFDTCEVYGGVVFPSDFPCFVVPVVGTDGSDVKKGLYAHVGVGEYTSYFLVDVYFRIETQLRLSVLPCEHVGVVVGRRTMFNDFVEAVHATERNDTVDEFVLGCFIQH
jgi:hypothetical protein